MSKQYTVTYMYIVLVILKTARTISLKIVEVNMKTHDLHENL